MAKNKATSEQSTSVGPSAKEAEFRMIPLRNIIYDPNQPRKFFDETSMQELIESIKQNGVLQPIMVRTTDRTRIAFGSKPCTPSFINGYRNEEAIEIDGGSIYMVVAGERRCRAAEEAGLEEIPAVIRTLSDEETLEIQIVENLQRKDVQPMEEAVAFKSLKDKFSIEEIAQRVGKSGHYVAQRMKLTELIPEFQELLHAGKMKIVDAGRLCRFSPAIQKEIYKECSVPKDWAKRKDFELGNISWYLNRSEQSLDEAPFKTNDPDLYPDAGACNTCMHNSHVNKLLFPDLFKKRICHNAVCYQIKVQKNYQKQIEAAMQDPEVLFVTTSGYLDDQDKAKIKAAEELGAVVLSNDLFETVQKPYEPPSWEDYLKEHDDWSDDKDLTEEDKKWQYEECRAEWEESMEDYKHELKEFEKVQSEGHTRKAFVVAGYRNSGQLIDIKLSPKRGSKVTLDSTGSNEAIALDLELSGIREREARNKELDREKVYKKSVDLLKDHYLSSNDHLHSLEWKALAILLADSSYKARDFIQEKLSIGSDYSYITLFKKIPAEVGNYNAISQMIRQALYDRLVSVNDADFEKSGKAAAMFEIAKLYIPKEVKALEAEQQEKAEKRITNVTRRIEDLEEKKAALKETAATK